MALDQRPPSVVGYNLIIWSALLGLLAVLSTAIRIVVRSSRRTFGYDDVFMIAALLCTIVRYGVNFHAVRAGYGQHQDTLEAKQYEYTNFLSWVGQIFLFTSLCLLKVSIGLLIMRIKDTRRTRIFQWTLIAGLLASNIEVLIVLLAECRPMKGYWEKGAGKCWPNKIRIYSIYIQVGYGILTDLIYSLMPIFIVWKLHMPWQKKASICGLMCIGLIATVCAAMSARSIGQQTSDLSWDYAIAAIWGNVELGLGIIAANMVLVKSYISFFRGDKQVLTSTSTNQHSVRQDNYSLTKHGWVRQRDEVEHVGDDKPPIQLRSMALSGS